MTQNRNYLSDEELELLIADVEQKELVLAPPDMLEEILKRVDLVTKPKSNIREFRMYCLKVCASVAAAVILVFALPSMSENLTLQEPERECSGKESRFATREEFLNNQGYFTEKFGGTNIFSGERELGIFTGRNGGR